MHKKILDILVDPISRKALQIESYEVVGDNIVEGMLHSDNNRSYAISNGIPRFIEFQDDNQRQTESSFSYKWQKRIYDSPQVHATSQQWLLKRYGFESVIEMRNFFGNSRRILDAGCGSGFSTSLWIDPLWRNEGKAEWYGMDISAGIDVAQERLGSIPGAHFIQADILNLPFAENTFDIIFVEGVLHHTPSTEKALKSLLSVLEPGGEVMFYVYRKKSPIREFTDDYIRDVISSLPPEKAWDMLSPLTKLGQSLSELNIEIDIPEDIPYLGIKAGRYDVQRLIYWHFAKLFWNDKFPFEVNNHVNFDWYHPKYAHRHTEDEIRRWCSEANLSVTRFDVEESGFTVRAIKG
jgi:SAM-dependent methyltransferase